MTPPRKAIYRPRIGGIIKRISGSVSEGHLIRWQDEGRKDLQGEWFSPKTFLMRNAGYPVVGAPINYQHGMHKAREEDEGAKDFGSLAIGIFTFADEDDIGLFVRGEQKTRAEYIEMLQEIGRVRAIKFTDAQLRYKADIAVKAVDDLMLTELQYSGGFDPSTWVVDPDNQHIDQSGIIHGAWTPTPADDLNPLVRFKSAFDEVLTLDNSVSYSIPPKSIQPAKSEAQRGGTGRDSAQGTEADVEPTPAATPETTNDDIAKNGATPMSELVALAQSLLEALEAQAIELGVSEEEAEGLAQEVVDETAQEAEAKQEDEEEDEEEMDEEEDEEQKAVAFARRALAILNEKVARLRKAQKAAQGVLAQARLEHQKKQPATNRPPAYAGQGYMDSYDNLKYAHLSATDMAMAFKIAVTASPFGRMPQGLRGRNATDFVTEEFYRHAVHKMAEQVKVATFSRAEDALYVKSITPVKANELNASDITGQGLEYLGNVYDTMVWETARNARIYQLMLNRGMMEKPVPQGMKSVIVPIEGADLSVYGGVEGNSTDATGRPEVVYKITPQTTSTETVTPGTFRTATAYTFELDEDSFVDMAAEANRKVQLALKEHIEKAMINGDTEPDASTNINDIAGTPTSTGLTRDYFLEFDGLRKSPLVTSTAYSRAGGTLAVDDYRRTWALLGSTQAPRTESIFFLIDFSTFNASLDLLPTLTKDVAGENAALFTGKFDELWGIPIYMSGFLALSNSAGKIDLDTPGNNTLGQILAVYAPYWAFVFKRNITIEMQRSPDSETFEFYGSMRFSLKRRSASAAAISYNMTV